MYTRHHQKKKYHIGVPDDVVTNEGYTPAQHYHAVFKPTSTSDITATAGTAEVAVNPHFDDPDVDQDDVDQGSVHQGDDNKGDVDRHNNDKADVGAKAEDDDKVSKICMETFRGNSRNFVERFPEQL